jgi:hypothetical protein
MKGAFYVSPNPSNNTVQITLFWVYFHLFLPVFDPVFTGFGLVLTSILASFWSISRYLLCSDTSRILVELRYTGYLRGGFLIPTGWHVLDVLLVSPRVGALDPSIWSIPKIYRVR